MENRTTASVTKDEHQKASEVKDEYGESWNDVLRFYRNHRDEVALSDGGDGQADGELADSLAEIEKRTGRIEQALEEMQR